MGEIFRRESAEHPEPFTGERLTTAIGGQVQVEHYHRYLFSRSLARGLDVLDVASGEGYGSALLAQVARSVVGVEYSGPTGRNAMANFPRRNLRFLQGDARCLPLADGCVDLVVSFETIEHFDRQDEFLREVRRVLRPAGCCIISTPDRDVYSPTGSAANPYHVQELTQQEFAAMLSSAFRNVAMLRQRPLIGSALLADGSSNAPPLIFDRRGDTHFEACTGLPRAPYLLAIASDRELPALPPSLYIDRSDLDSEQRRAMALTDQLHRTQAELSQTQRERTQAQADLAQAAADLAQAATDLARAAADHAQTTASLHDTQQHVHQIKADRIALEHRNAVLERQHDELQGSFRMFMRGYLPRLRRHLLGQRP
jgi:SAM-dependent methyltransferase